MLLVRHGQASFGAADYDVLSDLGRRQAEIVAASLAERGYRPARLVGGTLRRQRETAAAFGALGAPELEVDGRWDEYDLDEVFTHHGGSALRLDSGGGGETTDNRGFQAVLEPALAEWVEHAERSPAAQTWPQFAGAGSRRADATSRRASAKARRPSSSPRAARSRASSAPCSAPRRRPSASLNRTLVNSSVTKLAIGSTGINVVSYNDHSHLETVDRALVTYR